MRFRLISLYVIVVLALMLAASCSKTDPPVVTNPAQDLTVTYVTQDLDTADLLNDAAWDNVDESYIRIGESATYTNQFGLAIVRAKAIADGQNVYLRFSWGDGTESNKPGFWSFFDEGTIWRQNADSNGFSVANALNPRWTNDDQLALIFDNGSNGSEGANCALMCHQVGSEDTMWVSAGNVDVWVWRAGRTDPLGLADDMYWGPNSRAFDDFSQNREAYTRNAVNPDAPDGVTDPRWMHVDGPDYHGIFLFSEDTTAMNFTGQQFQWQAGDGVSGYVLEKDLHPSEAAKTSRYDVHAASEYDPGARTWNVVLWRKLNTGNEDDFAFEQGVTYHASLAMMDHTDNFHSGSRVFTIKF